MSSPFSQTFRFYSPTDPSDGDLLARNADRIALVSADAQTKEDLLSALAEELEFPSHFGRNWDALNDCLRDLSWLSDRRVVIVHEALPLADSPREAAMYLQLLEDACSSWTEDEQHLLSAYFPNSDAERVRTLLERD